MKLFIMQFSPTSCHFIFSSTPSVYVPPLMLKTKFHTHTEPPTKLTGLHTFSKYHVFAYIMVQTRP
jgi:hypothetical protein